MKTENAERGLESLVIDVLDVGHGSCVVVRSQDEVVLIDAGPGGQVLEYLRTEGITAIASVVVSHADADHIGGISAILSQGIDVGKLVWNGDSMKRSALWLDLVYQIAELQNDGVVVASQNAHDDTRLEVGSSKVVIDLLAPGLILRQLGAGGSLKDGRGIESNTVSVVAQIVVDGEPILLVPGDLDAIAFEFLSNGPHKSRLKTKYLLLPHHGGLLGTPRQTVEVVTALMDAVEPEVVFVSNGRGKFHNPRADVLDSVRKAKARVVVACTQLSRECAVLELMQGPGQAPYSAGWSRGHSCQGSSRISLGNGIGAPLDLSRHAEFLSAQVPASLCTR
ncbi:ComEC/Rec2 family competence protein [Demequina aestuarii]|uniref:ComEC/Rec2 family competence protein n=1 Tax=Demequina aestuarii TaxID=327095 RepID=UPI000782E27C|nr:MBL fold metallo-hydrolase [Demequina aestuarii]